MLGKSALKLETTSSFTSALRLIHRRFMDNIDL